MAKRKEVYEPTPLEIEKACRAMRAEEPEWKLIQRAHQCSRQEAMKMLEWAAPLVHLSGLENPDSVGDDGSEGDGAGEK